MGYLEVAVGVDEEVGRLEVPVDDLQRVHVLDPAQHLGEGGKEGSE